MTYKIFSISDSLLISTGYANQSRHILKRLARDRNYEVTHLGLQYIGNPMWYNADGNMLYSKEQSGCVKLVPNQGGHPFAGNLWEPMIKMLQPDITWCLLDSVTEDRILPILYNKKIEMLTVKEIYERFGIEPESIKTLVCKYDKYRNKTYAEWEPILYSGRRHVDNYPVLKIRQKVGETKVTEGHSLIEMDEGIFKKIKATDFIKLKKRLVTPDRIRRKRQLKGSKALIRFIAAYLSEGCLSKYERKDGKYRDISWAIIISNKNRNWLEHLQEDIKTVWGKKSSITNPKSGVHNLVFWSKDIYIWLEKECGKGAKNKKIPSFIFDLRPEFLKEFLKTYAEGDGHIYDRTSYIRFYRKNLSFSFSSSSSKIIAGLCFILKCLGYKFSLHQHHLRKDNYSIFTSSFYGRDGKDKTQKENYTGYIYDFTVGNGEMFLDAFGMVACGNSFMLFDWVLKIDFTPSKFIFYFPSDGEYTLPARCEEVIKKANVPVAMSKFAQEQVRREYGLDVDYIPHGVPTDFYYPANLDRKQALREKWSRLWNIDLRDKFVILFVGRNQGRKALPELMKIIGKFYKMHKDIVFIIHADPEDNAGIQPAFSIFDLLKRNKIEGITRFTGMKFWWGFPEEDLREIYQISDVHASSTTGEGWGITTTESMSCGVPNIITDFTTTKEILEDGKFGIPVPVKMTITGTWAVERAFIDIDKFVEGLETLYKDENLRKSMGRLSREKVVREYDLERTVFPQWNKLLQRELNL
jgi:glycosyltransferase involved in cell wall biosynthesis